MNPAACTIALPQIIGSAVHNCVLLASVYNPVFHRLERAMKTVKSWTADGFVTLQGCLDCTEWHMIYDACDYLN